MTHSRTRHSFVRDIMDMSIVRELAERHTMPAEDAADALVARAFPDYPGDLLKLGQEAKDAGFRGGFLEEEICARIVEKINAAGAKWMAEQ